MNIYEFWNAQLMKYRSKKGTCTICKKIRLLHYLTNTCKDCYNAVADYNSKSIAEDEPRYSVKELKKIDDWLHFNMKFYPIRTKHLFEILEDKKKVKEVLK